MSTAVVMVKLRRCPFTDRQSQQTQRDRQALSERMIQLSARCVSAKVMEVQPPRWRGGQSDSGQFPLPSASHAPSAPLPPPPPSPSLAAPPR